MATSAIGPGFLTQTTVFTQQLLADFGFVILLSVLLDIGVQVNIWRILSVSGLRAQDLANRLLPGLGYFIALLIVLGALAFNIGNIAGCGLGLNTLTGLPVKTCAVVSCIIGLLLFWMKEAGRALDTFTRVLGLLMILFTLYIAVSSHPPLLTAVRHSFVPEHIDAMAIITLVGGTVGGYISFAGAHRLLDAGIQGADQLKQVNKSAVSGICVTACMRFLLFLAALGVVVQHTLDANNPPASVFRLAAGETGYRFFGVVMWCAAITSVVGSAYTAMSFLKTFHPAIEKLQQWLISIFIVFSTTIFLLAGNPVRILVMAGALNGMILPLTLAVMLAATGNKQLMKDYRHPVWLQVAGWVIVVVMGWLGFATLKNWLV
jgi:Mn2+/Fe2+ NRAMP family transporter